MKVVDMKAIREEEKKNLISTIEEAREKIENGEIESFVICSLRTDQEIEIMACVKDRLDAIGLIESSKMLLFTNGQQTN